MTRPLAAILIALVWASACSDAALTLVYPPELTDGTAQAAILVYQGDQNPGSEVLSAELLEPPLWGRKQFALQDPSKHRFLLLAYDDRAPLDALMLAAGPLPRATAGEGVPIPVSASAYLSSALDGPQAEWNALTDFDPSPLAWRVPGLPASADCIDVSTRATLINGLELVRPRGLIALGNNRAVVAGQYSAADGKTTLESLLVLVSNLDGTPTFESLAAPIADENYRGLIELSPGVILASSTRGSLTRVNVETREVLTVQTGLLFGYWQLSLGEDGTLVAFDTRDLPGSPRRRAHFVDPDTLAVTLMEAPEPFLHVSVIRRDLMFAAGANTLYRFEGGSWILEQQTDGPITELLEQGTRIVAMVGGALLLERQPDATWLARPHDVPVFDLLVGSFFPDGRLILGGAAGYLAQYRDGEWCNIQRSLSREVLAISPVPGETAGLSVTYGERPGEWAGVTRIELAP